MAINTWFGISEVLINSTLIDDCVIGNSSKLYTHSCSDISVQFKNLFPMCLLHYGSTNPMLNGLIRMDILILDFTVVYIHTQQ